ncbi:uncharacterized protein CC84DRAFT_1165430 [Paraphaeosphaeria sporulosa]|uniref:Secreted protein n=1 Tax=Paraphaeosphaeria sporulosa TaxID=1460663 RepID=A0A177CDV7_9PLEO|nr:uncharacterized protein CC84DRAFT_1165430 [Paraphaeosphaeria sporulosa]OAG05102.1 hypothetical protein CC84DRAFT_1165430 [Paraphaeosphaeria sporulosa]
MLDFLSVVRLLSIVHLLPWLHSSSPGPRHAADSVLGQLRDADAMPWRLLAASRYHGYASAAESVPRLSPSSPITSLVASQIPRRRLELVGHLDSTLGQSDLRLRGRADVLDGSSPLVVRYSTYHTVRRG